MSNRVNQLGQPIGGPLPDWTPPPHPPRETMEGAYCRLEPLHPERHAEALYAAFALDEQGRDWTYLPHGPFDSFESFKDWIKAYCQDNDPLFFAIIPKTSGKAAGVACYLTISPASGSIEVGYIVYSELLKKSAAATEAMYLMMKRAFELGYRRYEWKCDALNSGSRKAAQRLGLSYEGTFRQGKIYKQRNCDTAWYAVIDTEWPALQKAFLVWLEPNNFDEHRRQRTRLSDLTHRIVKKWG